MEYRGFYKNYDMTNEIHIGSGTVKVHDIFDDLPEFMNEADCIFVDPPCSEGNLKSFYTKADLKKRDSILNFTNRLFECLDLIKPKHIFFEVFKANYETVLSELKNRYTVDVYESYYYGKTSNKCWIFHAYSNEAYKFDIPLMDEEKVIDYICSNLDFSCIGDLCMGKGLVGYYANKNNKRFVGTELNKKRLACLIEHINKGKIIVR